MRPEYQIALEKALHYHATFNRKDVHTTPEASSDEVIATAQKFFDFLSKP